MPARIVVIARAAENSPQSRPFGQLTQLGPLAGIHVGSLDGSEPKRLASADTTAVYDPQSGHLLFVRQGTLLAQPFDARALTLTGELFPIAEHGLQRRHPRVRSGTRNHRWFADHLYDRQGKQVESVGAVANNRGLDFAPDGERVAAHLHDANGGDIWTPKELFDSQHISLPHSTISPMFHPFVVSVDGQRFLIPHPPSNDAASLTMPIVDVENWAAEVRK